MNKALAAAAISLAISSALYGQQANAPATAPVTPVVTAQETKGTPDDRADQLIKEMTFDEKVTLLSGGQGGYSTAENTRLGIPAFWTADGPNGVRNPPQGEPTGTAYPGGSALAATWDPTLATAYGKAMGQDDRARGVYYQLGPGLNICRAPVNGRNFEYFGEDPYLASIMAVNWVKACSAQGSIPTIKHFACNNEESDRNTVNVEIDERTLNEIYLPAFKKAATEGGIVALMCSYNGINGHYASNNYWLLTQMLRQEWGFKGLVMSDWGASHDVTDIAMGLDLEMPSGTNLNSQNLQSALQNGTVKMADIDTALHRILRSEIAQGWLDAGWQQKNPSIPTDNPDSVKAAQDIAEASIVLLKNDHDTLPLDVKKVKTIVMVGPNATTPVPGQGGGRGGRGGGGGGGRGGSPIPINIGGGGSGAVRPASQQRIDEADYFKQIQKYVGDNAKVVYLPMPNDNGTDMFTTFANAKTAPGGQPGLTLTVEVTGVGPTVTIPSSVQTAVNATWQTDQLPFGVPFARNATLTWSGVLAPPQDGDWELRFNALGSNTTITIDGKEIENPNTTLVHLQKDKPSPIVIRSVLVANPPTGRGGGRAGGGGRGGRGRGGGNAQPTPIIQVGLEAPAIPDLTEVKTADAAIVCIGLNSVVEQEGRDRPFELPEIQQYLVKAVGAANPHTIVINNSGAAVGMTGWIDSTPAVLQAWYLGQEGGIAISKVLFGEVNPSGHLCSTFDKTWEENPAFANYPGKMDAALGYLVEHYVEGIFYGYRGYDKAGKDPEFPFGYGLSYTTFDLSNMKIDKSGSDVKVTVDVKNTGQRAGAEVVQIYVGEQSCPLPRPTRELKGFNKVVLDPGQTKSVEIMLPHDSFAYWSPDTKGWKVDSGNTFNIEAGISERDIKAKGIVVVQ